MTENGIVMFSVVTNNMAKNRVLAQFVVALQAAILILVKFGHKYSQEKCIMHEMFCISLKKVFSMVESLKSSVKQLIILLKRND